MGKYVSVRGWLECDEQTVHEVRRFGMTIPRIIMMLYWTRAN